MSVRAAVGVLALTLASVVGFVLFAAFAAVDGLGDRRAPILGLVEDTTTTSSSSTTTTTSSSTTTTTVAPTTTTGPPAVRPASAGSPVPAAATPAGSVRSTAYCLTGKMASGRPTYVGAVAGNRWPLGTRLRAWPNPWGDPGMVFTVEDRHKPGATELDFAMPRECSRALGWGNRRYVSVEVLG